MGTYRVAIVSRPFGWEPECMDDVPLELDGPVAVLGEWDDIFQAVNQAIKHNESIEGERRGRWAIVVEPGSLGRVWPTARLCTPLTYRVTAIWWPEGWEPVSLLDVPNCVWQSQKRNSGQWLSYDQAEATVRCLNQQCLNHPAATWYVVLAVENEAVSRTISYNSSGIETTVETRLVHVIRPKEGGRGDCSFCPAHDFQCAKVEWSSQLQTIDATRRRVVNE